MKKKHQLKKRLSKKAYKALLARRLYGAQKHYEENYQAALALKLKDLL